MANMSTARVSDGEMDFGGLLRRSLCIEMSLDLLRAGKRASGT